MYIGGVIPAESVTLKRVHELLLVCNLFKTIGFQIREVSAHQLEVRLVYYLFNEEVISNIRIVIDFMRGVNQIVLKSHHDYNIDYDDLIFKKGAQLISLYDIKVEFRELKDNSSYNFRVMASNSISYSRGFNPDQFLAELRTFDDVLTNLDMNFQAFLFEGNYKSIAPAK